MSDVTLYGLPPSSYCRSALMMLEAKGVAYALEPARFRDDSYRSLHPFARMPALSHGGHTIFEATAIGIYVDEAFDGPALQPSGALGRARMVQWMSATVDYFYEVMVRQCVAERFVKPMRGLEPDLAVLEAARPKIAEQLSILNAALTDQEFLAGPGMSLADHLLAPILVYLRATPEGQDLMPEAPKVAAWMDRMAQAPGFDRINALG